jgi:hypothetical protein
MDGASIDICRRSGTATMGFIVVVGSKQATRGMARIKASQSAPGKEATARQ